MRWMVKLAGMLCILSASVLAGIWMEARLKKRFAILREMGEILTFLEKEMTLHKAPAAEAFKSAAGRCGTELSEVFSETASGIMRRDGKSFREIWESSVRQRLPRDVLEQEEMELICETAAALCNTDTVLQRTLLEKYTDRFREKGRAVSGECREKGNLYRKLAVAAGVFLIILFW